MLTFRSMLPSALSALSLLAPSAAHAATIGEDLQSLVGEWQGESTTGAKVSLTTAAGHEDLVSTGSLKFDGGAFASQTEFSVVLLAGQYFMVPAASPFAPGKDVYTVTHLPNGSLRFSRLMHGAQEDGPVAGLQTEDIEISRARANGTRTMRVSRSERLCADDASPAGKICGPGAIEHIVLHKVGQ